MWEEGGWGVWGGLGGELGGVDSHGGVFLTTEGTEGTEGAWIMRRHGGEGGVIRLSCGFVVGVLGWCLRVEG